MSEITIVTAIFDIGRNNWQEMNRNLDKYVDYFAFWARLRNKVIIYTDQATSEKILKIRDQFNLRDRTEIVVVEDIKTCDNDIYNKIKTAMANKISRNFHRYPNHPEANSPDYNYLMLMKSYFVADAVNRKLADGMIAWMDFGYNHGGETYTNPEEFDYLWQYEFDEKINLFALRPLEDKPIFHIVKSMDVYISGGLIIAPDYMWESFWQRCRESMVHLTACGLADDDQTILLMAYRQHPEMFAIHYIEDWLLPLKLYGGEHLTIKSKPKKSPISLWWRGVKAKLKE